MFKLQHSLNVSLAAFLTGLLVMATPVLAIHPEEKSEIENLKKRIDMLETRKTATLSSEQESSVDFGRISKYVTLHGLFEAEAYYARPEGGEEESGLNLATAELSIEVTINDFVGGHLTLLYEEEEGEHDDIDVDEAVISLASPGQLFGQAPSLHVGRMYVPFGMYNSYMISDPLTLELGETQDTAALFALEGDVWVLKAGVLSGETGTNSDSNHIDNWVASLALTTLENLAFGVSYINDLAESNNELVQDDSLYSSNIAGASAFLSVQCGQFGFEAEYLTALEDFDPALVGVGEDLTGRRPSAWNLELAWMPTDRLQLAARYEEANDFQDDVKRYGGTISYGLYEHVVVALEYLRADADIDEDDMVDILTAQLAFEF